MIGIRSGREIPVALITAGHGHHRTGAVAAEHVIAHPHRHIEMRERMDATYAPVNTPLTFSHRPCVRARCGSWLGSRRPSLLRGAPRCDLLISSCSGASVTKVTPKRVSGRVVKTSMTSSVLHLKRITTPLAPADPIALCLLDALAPIERVQAIEQALRVGGDAHAPLRHALALHGMSAAFAHAVLHFIVGEHGAQCGAPVHPGLAEVGQSEALQDLLLARSSNVFQSFSAVKA
jgi:hypothetical protein